MALKQYKPTTPGQRGLVLIDRSQLHKGGPVKALTEGQHRHGGRNNTGRITVRYQGGGHKQRYRIIDFKRRKLDIPGIVERLEYDPNRTAFIALIKYKDGELAYILAPQRLAVGDAVIAGDKVDVKPGNAMPLSAMPVGTIVHNIEMKPGKGGQWHVPLAPMRNILAVTRLCDAAPEFGRSAPRAFELPRDGWCRLQPGSHERSDRQGWPQCVEGQTPPCARHRDEPD